MASYYPHKQTALIAIICVLAVGGVFVYAKRDAGTKSSGLDPVVPVDIDTVPPNSAFSASSTDWRLSFIDKPVPAERPGTTIEEDLTLTDQFGRDFFARYIQLRQSNLIENQSFVTDTLNQSIYSAARSAEQPRTYSISDISTIPDTTSAHIRSYGNSVGSIFSTYGVDGDPAIIANDAFEKGDMLLLAQIDPITASYQRIAQALKALPVPQPLAPYHIDLLNAVSGMEKITRDIRAVESDPMQTMVSVSTYATVQNTLIASLKSMKSYFSLTGVSFASTEAGSLFSQIL